MNDDVIICVNNAGNNQRYPFVLYTPGGLFPMARTEVEQLSDSITAILFDTSEERAHG